MNIKTLEINRKKLIHSLNNEIRIEILSYLSKKPLCVSELTELLNSGQSNVSQQLSCLRDCGLIEQERKGKHIFYSLVSTEITDLIRQMDSVIESLKWNEETKIKCENHEV